MSVPELPSSPSAAAGLDSGEGSRGSARSCQSAVARGFDWASDDSRCDECDGLGACFVARCPRCHGGGAQMICGTLRLKEKMKKESEKHCTAFYI